MAPRKTRSLSSLDRTLVLSVTGTLWAIVVSARSLYSAVLAFIGSAEEFPSPYGIQCLLGSTALAQVILISYYARRRLLAFETSKGLSVQTRNIQYDSTFPAELKKHLNRPEVAVLGGFLITTWMFKLLPKSYYDTEAPVSFFDVLKQLLLVDFFTFSFHVVLHHLPRMYVLCHKQHHKFTNPQLFNTFDATVYDSLFLILLPVYATANSLDVNCFSYVVAGVVYASQFMLLHSEFENWIDPYIRKLGIMTAADHHVHHALPRRNLGHFFRIYDLLGGTYTSPREVRGFRDFADIKST